MTDEATQATESTPTETGQTISEALKSMASGAAVAEGSEVEKPPTETLEAPPTPAQRERDEHGRFIAAETTETVDDEPAETETTDAELEDAPEAEKEAETEAAPTITIPGENEGDELELEIDDPAVADRIQALTERAAQADVAEATAKQMYDRVQETLSMRRELDDLHEEMQEDPLTFLTEGVRPELRKELVLDLLLDPEVYESTMEAIGQWTADPAARDLLSASRRAERAEKALKRQDERASAKAMRETADQIVNRISAFVPAVMEPTTAKRFYGDMVRDVTDHLNGSNVNALSEADLRSLLSFRFKQYGVSPEQMNGAPRDASSGAIVAQPIDEAGKRIAEARATGVRLKKSHQARRAAGASAPVGAGSPATRTGPPVGASLKEALDHARKAESVR